MRIFYLVLILHRIQGKLPDAEKLEFCDKLICDDSVDDRVCGVRFGEQVSYRLFDNECQLLQYGCQVDDTQAYGIINLEYCSGTSTTTSRTVQNVKFINYCADCSSAKNEPVCGIRKAGNGYKIRTFANECELTKHNCMNATHFIVTDFFICTDSKNENSDKEITDVADPDDLMPKDAEPNKNIPEEAEPVYAEEPLVSQNEQKKINKMKSVVVVDGSMFDKRNINESIENFFAATHVLDMPVINMQPNLNVSSRRLMIDIFGPVQVFKPWIKIPENISDDHYHSPTLASCYHKCPTKCPDTYAPVCGVPGIVAREPSLMFQNHCFMDVAQCKMYWDAKSFTAESSAYIESSFVFCLGEQLNGLYRFLPLIKTLQHMGRLKKKSNYRYKLRNLRFLNNFVFREPKIMG